MKHRYHSLGIKNIGKIFCLLGMILAAPLWAQNSMPTYRVGTLVSFPPFTLLDKDGNPSGFDIDLLRAMGERAGFNIKVMYQPWKASLPALDEGTRDIIATGVVINEERQEKYDFSDPYLETKWMAVLRDQTKKGKEKFVDFQAIMNDPNLVYTTEDGAAGMPLLKKMLADKPNKLVTSGSQFLEIKDVMLGKADVAYDISSVFQYYINRSAYSAHLQSMTYTLIDPNAPVSYMGFAVKKGNQEVLEKLNEGLKMVKKDGTYQRLIDKWF